MTTTELIKNEIKKLRINLNDFEIILDLSPGLLDHIQWEKDIQKKVYNELFYVYNVNNSLLNKELLS